jgi:succinate-semialdehyde dehydrogenase / glutarate-semialdehyde dehydrogenase
VSIASINPATGQTLKRFEEHTAAEVEAKLKAALHAFGEQRKLGYPERAERLRKAAGILECDKQRFGRMMTEEMGKTLVSAVAEAEKCASGCRYYADHGEALLRDEPIASGAVQSYVRYLPLGVVLAVMPWNFPFWQVVRFAAPALMAGNVGLLKHASNVPQCALALEALFLEAGFPPGSFQTLLLGSERVGALIDDPRARGDADGQRACRRGRGRTGRRADQEGSAGAGGQ